MILRPAAEIYRDCQNDRKLYVCHNYPACNTYVAAHPGTNQPMGVPANGDLRNLRIQAHRKFDRIWQTGIMTRENAYRWFADSFGLSLKDAHIGMCSEEAEGPKSALSKNLKLVLAVTLHNIPEGMAVGVVLAGWLTGGADLSLGAALALSLGIAIQNFPEGAIISLPLATNGEGRAKAFVLGTLSGIVEPIGGALTIVAASVVVPVLPYLLAFAAGAMLYVVVEELIPEMSVGHHSNIGVVAFSVGFTLMMALDTILG